jgi:hypothetical protein
MRKSIAAALIAASAAALAGCNHRAGDHGATVSRNYQVGQFQQIEVAGPYDVEVRTGSNVSVAATGSERLLSKTVVEVRGGELLIHPQENHGFHLFSFGSHGSARFVVTVPQLTGAKIAGSGDIKIDKVQGNAFDGSVAGSGDLAVAAMDVQSLNLSIAGSGGIKAGSGRAQSVTYGITGSGDIDAGAVAANAAKVSIAGSGSIRAQAHGTADVSVMGSGDVDVTGGAKCTVNKSGSGDVRCS